MPDRFEIKFSLDNIQNEREVEDFRQSLKALSGVVSVAVDGNRGVTVVSERHISLAEIKALLPTDANSNSSDLAAGVMRQDYKVKGMHCRSCEITIERQLKTLPNVVAVDVNSGTGKLKLTTRGPALDRSQIESLLQPHGYSLEAFKSGGRKGATSDSVVRLSFWRLLGLFAIVYVLGRVLLNLGWLVPQVSMSNSTSLAAVFLMGLVAASSSCVAISGGLLLSAVTAYRDKYGLTRHPFVPVLTFVLGRVAGYTFFGALLGWLGGVLALPPLAVAAITVLAAVYMLIMGLDMLQLAPNFVKRVLPRTSKDLSHALYARSGSTHPLAPFGLGAATFFLPCGFTQSLQLYALTTGSAITSAAILGVFALGTAPSLMLLGWAAGSLKGKAGQLFFQLAGAAVILLGIWNLQNGFTIAGYPISGLVKSISQISLKADEVRAAGVEAEFDGQVQTIRMGSDLAGYSPDEIVLRVGVPTRWIIDGDQMDGCLSVIQVPKLKIQRRLVPGQNVIEFTPRTIGDLNFSCGMGMYRGVFHVVEKI